MEGRTLAEWRPHLIDPVYRLAYVSMIHATASSSRMSDRNTRTVTSRRRLLICKNANDLVSRLGIEPRTRRLRVCCSAS